MTWKSLALAAAFGCASALFSPAFAASTRDNPAERLARIRTEVIELEQGLLDGVRTQQAVKANLKKMRMLLKLQKRERDLGAERLAELQKTVVELETRRETLSARISQQQAAIRKFLASIERSSKAPPSDGLRLPEQERLEAPRRKTLAAMAARGFREVEALKVDLADAGKLEARIAEEKSQLAYLFQDLDEQRSVLELNSQLQEDLLQKKHDERLSQLQSYRKLKDAEEQVEHLIGEFNAKKEIERAAETERVASKAMMQGEFAKLKGHLPLPAGGRIVSGFGRSFDPRSRLYVFKKGVDIAAGKKVPVRAISAGKVAYVGELPDYGRVTIIDHGEHFYSLCAHLGALARKPGEAVSAGDAIGESDESGTPVYFEIRARNVAVNPLQWVSN